MDHFDNEYFDFMDDMGASNMPEGFAWGDVKEGIYAKQKRKRRMFPFIWWSGLGLALVAVVFIWFNPDMALNEIAPVLEIQQQRKTAPLKEAKTNKPKEIIATNNMDKAILEAEVQSVADNEISEKKIKISKVGSKKDKKASLIEKKIIAQNTQGRELENASNINSPKVIEVETVDKALSISVAAIEKAPILNAIKLYAITRLPMSNLNLLTYTEKSNGALPISALRLEPEELGNEAKKLINKKWSLNTFAGANIWSSKYDQSDILAKDRNNSTAQLLGFTTSFGAEKMLSKHFFVGLETSFITWNSKFESDATRMIDVELKDVVLVQNRNILTGDIDSEKLGDVTVQGSEYRYVRHYNTLNAVRFGAMLGYKLPLMEKLNLDFKLGSGYFVVTKQAGKTHINDLDILEYNNSEPIYKMSGISIQPAIRLNYSFNNKIGIGVQLSHERFMANWSADNLNLQLGRTDLGATISYTL